MKNGKREFVVKGWQMGVSFFFIFTVSTVASFLFRGLHLPEDYKALLYPMIVTAVGAVVAGFFFHAANKDNRGPR